MNYSVNGPMHVDTEKIRFLYTVFTIIIVSPYRTALQ